MIQKQDLLNNFSDLVELGSGIVRCQDKTPRSTYYYYIQLSTPGVEKGDFLVVSENRLDDDFARKILGCVPRYEEPSILTAVKITSNKYGFSTVLIAPKDYHAYFKGILDDKREHLVLCLPVHQCEFSGDESVNEFIKIRKEVVPSLDWERFACPKIVLRFDNPKTRGGTGNAEIFAKYELLLREIDNLNGVIEGYIEISNYRNHTIEILSPEIGKYVLIMNRNDENRETMEKESLLKKLWAFLNEAP